MNKKQIFASLNKIANELDNTGLYQEANSITNVMKRIAEEESNDNGIEPARKSHLERMIEQFERTVKRINEEEDDSYNRMMARKKEFLYTMDDLDPEDRAEFEKAYQEMLNKMRDSGQI